MLQTSVCSYKNTRYLKRKRPVIHLAQPSKDVFLHINGSVKWDRVFIIKATVGIGVLFLFENYFSSKPIGAVQLVMENL